MAEQVKYRRYPWLSLSDEELLDLKFSELNLQFEGTAIDRRIQRLWDELDARGFRFSPHFWFATEWFAPEHIPGVGVPFYLAHPRLMRLERKQVFEVEGKTEQSAMKLLRHETGHAFDTAYQLFRKRGYQRLFGKTSTPYPQYYTPRPYSRSYVLHLDLWYAQAHPMEDFAETFAVWLGNPKTWRKKYKGWRALKKLEYIDEVLNEIKQEPPVVTSRRRVGTITRLQKTLRQHYEEKRERYGLDDKAFYDRELVRLFTVGTSNEGRTAASFLRSHRGELRRSVAKWTGESTFTVDQIVEQMIERSAELKLRAIGDEQQLLNDTIAMLAVQATNSLLSGRYGIPV